MRRLSFGIAVAIALSGCAVLDSGYPEMSWAQYLAGDDLSTVCEPGITDRFRIVFDDRRQPRGQEAAKIRIFEIVGRRDSGGADVAARTITADDMRQIRAVDAFDPWRGTDSSLTMTPLQFAELANRLDRMGAFDKPAFGVPRRPNRMWWLISGCRGGERFFNAFDDPAVAGMLIRWP